MTNIYVQTRGKNTDYAFLGGAPSKLWWLDFRDATSFEQPTIIVRGDGSEWRCFVSGLQSGRRDRVGTIVRYSLVLEGQCGEAKDSAMALNLVADALTGQRIQAKLDNEFDEATVERLLSNRGANPDDRGEVGRLAAQALSNLEPPKPHIKPTETESWVGSITSSFAQSEFLARSTELFGGERKGVAALLNLLGTEDEATKLLEQQAVSLAVLIPATLSDNVVPIFRSAQKEEPLDSSKKKVTLPKPQPALAPQDPPTTLQGVGVIVGVIKEVLAIHWRWAVILVIAGLLVVIWPNNPTTPQPQPPTNQR